MTSPDQFRAPPPESLDSKEYAEELAYVAKVGPRDDADRTEYETMSTPFWTTISAQPRRPDTGT